MSKPWEKTYLDHVVHETGMSLSAIAAKAKISSTTLTRPMNSADHKFSLKRATLDRVASATGISYLPFQAQSGGHPAPDTNYPSEGETALVPVYDVSAAAGAGMTIEEYEAVATNLAFPQGYLSHITRTSPNQLAIISVVGGSMAPTLAHDDIVMVDMTKTRWAFDGIYVVRVDDLLKVKRIRRSGREGWIVLHSDNPQFPDEDVPAEEVSIVGRVVWSGRKEA